MANSGTDYEPLTIPTGDPPDRRIDGDDYTYDLRTGPERTAAQLAKDEARLADAETRLEQLEEHADLLAARLLTVENALRNMANVLHRYLNRAELLTGDVGQEQ